ncbi:MAG: hypothetical protein M3478_13750 [Planctomycetota bacterium]|nr:hypothetical protein [Planctomycetota bacterium]
MSTTSGVSIAYVAEGKLYVRRPGSDPQLIDSPFVQGILDRVERARERNDWKSQGMAWGFGSQMRGPFGPVDVPAERRRIRFTGVAASGTNELLYALDTDHVGGLFRYEVAAGTEQRLFHRQQFRASDLSAHPVDGSLVFSVRAADGTARVATMAPEGKGLKELTEGDAVDEAPAWAGGTGKVIVFQSAGIGRNEAGIMTGLSPYAVMRLDLDAGTWETLIEEENHDALLPRLAADGTLYFIRRPYEPLGRAPSLWRVGLDVLLFPIRLVQAIVHFLNFFSLMFSRKPLITSGGPPREPIDQRHLMLWGRVVDAQKALAKTDRNGAPAALVPANWQLIRRDAAGNEQAVATNVLAYDIALAGGGIVYTDGATIRHRASDGTVTTVGTGTLVERVTILG